ncbi:MAG: hydroxymethylglutaryl-CoA reductase, degradative [Eudoraea sp.]|nr:hydroxymethylglutaryl-CoA reductase, degradative [Eudoraea sp.]
MTARIDGFSKLSKEDKIDWIVSNFTHDPERFRSLLVQYWNDDSKLQRIHDEFAENTISNFYLPLGIAPNFLINDKIYVIPMVVEESSVVAAASKAAKYWQDRGGFKAEVLRTEKVGQVHFTFNGDPSWLEEAFLEFKSKLIQDLKPIMRNMEDRGGGLLSLELRNKTALLDNYYQLHATFETKDAMGANFINSCLEQLAATWEEKVAAREYSGEQHPDTEVIMSILSNYVPDCIVRTEVSCPVSQLDEDAMDADLFAKKIIQAATIAQIEPYRAVTHNKGIMNGVDAVVIATGNDFRAIEAGIHAYAAREGSYRGLSTAWIEEGQFTLRMDLPLALGTVGGLTRLHPLVRFSLEVLGQPSAKELMQLVAVAGLAQNFAALRSLVTTGIQQGHMKMHLLNILNQLGASTSEKEKVVAHFRTATVSFSAAQEVLEQIRLS